MDVFENESRRCTIWFDMDCLDSENENKALVQL
jgi:hypothetical protein